MRARAVVSVGFARNFSTSVSSRFGNFGFDEGVVRRVTGFEFFRVGIDLVWRLPLPVGRIGAFALPGYANIETHVANVIVLNEKNNFMIHSVSI